MSPGAATDQRALSVDETPDQILARLQRHAESVRRGPVPVARARAASPTPVATGASGLPSRSLLQARPPSSPAPSVSPLPLPSAPRSSAPPAGAPARVAVAWNGAPSTDFIPNDALRAPPIFGLILRTIAGQALAVVSCVAALLVSIHLSVVASLAVVGTVIAIAAIGAVRRVPFCGWCLLGLGIGLTLGRFS